MKDTKSERSSVIFNTGKFNLWFVSVRDVAHEIKMSLPLFISYKEFIDNNDVVNY